MLNQKIVANTSCVLANELILKGVFPLDGKTLCIFTQMF